EVNENNFTSFVGLAQHKIDFNFAKSSLIVGAVLDYSPQKYWAKESKVTYNEITEKYTDFDLTGLYKMFYDADILNYAGYAQFEISPLENLKVTAAVRYDGFSYDYDNKDEGKSGVKDQKVTYTNLSPKIGLNYNFTNKIGIYTNYSRGFKPPGISSLFRNRGLDGEVYKLKPTHFNSYEFGAYAMLGDMLKLDVALYRLDGKNRVVTTSDSSGNYIPQNAGETRSQGIEFGVNWKITEKLSFDYSGSHATHKYIKFPEVVKNYKTGKKYIVSHDDTDMPTAPFLINTMALKYTLFKDLLLTLQHEQVGKYNTSFENGAKINGKKTTATYGGYNLLNIKANYTYKKIDVWVQGLNLFDKLYSTRASYIYGKNSYSVGGPRAFHFGVKYNL
ncbi:TonB-dependent receptor, partial [Tenacibaculum piscium]